MNVAEFVEESLSQILAGIRAAQKKEAGEAVGAEMHGNVPSGRLIHGGTSGIFTVVDFDISVIAESKTEGKGGLRVWGVGGAEVGAGLSNHHTSRVQFSVQLRIPKGGKAPHSKFNDDIDYGRTSAV
jgi:hypothetical protein